MEANENQYWGMNEKSFLLLMHLGQFAGWIIPGAGFALPIIMWVTNKDNSERIDEQGKYITNWLISLTIYIIASSILMIIAIGFIGLIAAGLLALVFPIIGAIKANDGEIWKYPLTIQFIK
ncbi:MAG: DUF4870 domain-containing protein [Bacteroidales bacterium]|nr:DUF4870 domain-containing protein [Bacteroidales bacterium]